MGLNNYNFFALPFNNWTTSSFSMQPFNWFNYTPNYNFGSIFNYSNYPTPSYSTSSSFSFPTFNYSGITSSLSNFYQKAKSTVSNFADKTSTFIYNTVSKIKQGLFKGNLAGKEGVVTALCKKYGIKDVGMVASIICLESGYGTSNLARHNNFMGYRKAGDAGVSSRGFGYFSSAEKGLEAAIRNLARYTRFKDVTAVDWNNLDAIGRHYCNGRYANKIRAMYNSKVKKYLA